MSFGFVHGRYLLYQTFPKGSLQTQRYFNFSTPSSRRGTNKSKCEKGVLRNFTKFTGKHLCQSLFFNKVTGLLATFLKNRLWHNVFLWILWNFQEHHFYRRPQLAASVCTNLDQKCKLTKAYSSRKIWTGFRSSRSQIFFKIGVLQVFANSTGKHLCWRHFSRKLQSWKLYLQEISTQVFSCEIWKIFKNTIFYNISSGCFWCNWYFQRIPEQKPVQLSAINTTFSWKKVFATSTSVREIIP